MRMVTASLLVALAASGLTACSKSSGSAGSSTPAPAPTPSSTVTSTSTGSTVVTSTATGSATATGSTTPGSAAELATKLTLTAPSTTETTSACIALTVAAQDGSGTNQNVVNARTVNMTSTSSTGTYYSDSGCGTSATSVSITVGSATATVYYKDTATGTPTLTATDATTAVTALTAGTLQLTLATPAPTKLAFTNTALSQADGVCGALTITLEDQAGNPIVYSTTTGLIINVATSSSGEFYPTASCTNGTARTQFALGTSSTATTIYYADDAAGTPTLTATPAATGLTAGTQTATITAGVPSEIFLVADHSVAPGTCVTINLTIKDAAGDAAAPNADLPLTLSTTATTTGAFYPLSGCATAPVTTYTLATGDAYATLFYKETQGQVDTITVAPSSTGTLSTGTLAPGSLEITF